MKIIRFLDDDGREHAGAWDGDGTARRIEGDVFGAYTVTDEVRPIAKLLAPVAAPTILCIGLNYRRHAAESGAVAAGLSRPVYERPEHRPAPGRADPAADAPREREGGLRVRTGRRHRHERARTWRARTPWTTCSATPAPTTSARATGRSSAAEASGAGASSSTRSARSAPVSSRPTRSRTPARSSIRTDAQRRRGAGLDDRRHALRCARHHRVSEREHHARCPAPSSSPARPTASGWHRIRRAGCDPATSSPSRSRRSGA